MRPRGANADEWHLFLCERLDNRANHPNGLTYMALQIVNAIEEARDPYAALLAAAKEVISTRPFASKGSEFESAIQALRTTIVNAEKDAT